MNRQNPILLHLLLLLFGLLLTLAFVGCKTVKPAAPTVVDHTRDSVRTEVRHDSVYVDRWHKEYIKGDTVFIHDSIWRDRWHFDSIYINKVDSVPYPVEVEKIVEVEKPQSAFLKNSGIALWVLIGIFLIAIIIGIVLKFAK